jgi:hypothetical protein
MRSTVPRPACPQPRGRRQLLGLRFWGLIVVGRRGRRGPYRGSARERDRRSNSRRKTGAIKRPLAAWEGEPRKQDQADPASASTLRRTLNGRCPRAGYLQTADFSTKRKAARQRLRQSSTDQARAHSPSRTRATSVAGATPGATDETGWAHGQDLRARFPR